MYLVCRHTSPLFPYTTLFRSCLAHIGGILHRLRRDRLDGSAAAVGDPYGRPDPEPFAAEVAGVRRHPQAAEMDPLPGETHAGANDLDRKSTRLNSSHRCISYAVTHLPSFPTRRSSDLVSLTLAAFFIACGVIVSMARPLRSVIRTVARIRSHLPPKSQV